MLYMVIEKYRHGPGPVYQTVPVITSAEAAARVDVRWDERPAADELAGRAASVPPDVTITSLEAP
jgi:hypothetical protein